MDGMFFNGWDVIIRTIVIGILAYISLVILLRVSGKRSLTKMNAFDFVVTVALGSILASVIITKDISLAQGVTAFLVLLLSQLILTKLSYHFKFINNLVKSEPSLLYYNGTFIRYKMKKERLDEIEIRQAVRSAGFGDFDEVTAVILETDGSISVISSNDKNHQLQDNPLFSDMNQQVSKRV